ncbi:hypothetical protein NW762_012470 [Fusarium torreyae]|uniref:Uncharacterized protein n=1 Tax=Fusarium torreyae TaxID=1237075 RepID=A0A9W8V9N6_9HYPO|nr:hypothetical protein NW762_012470 [Fusarium torreyae]
MRVSQIINVAVLCGFAVGSPLPADALAEREANPQNTYGKAYTLKMKDDGFEKRQNTYGKAYTLKMKDDGFEKRDPQNTYGRAYTLKMKDDGF